MQAFVDMLAALYADPNIGTDVVWSPASGEGPFTLRALRGSGDQLATFDQLGDRTTPVRHIRLLVSECEAKAPGLKPAKNDLITVDGAERLVLANRGKEDDFRLQWTLDLVT